ncbi:hypothetical protein L3049_14185 [Labilibaculum sp. DW002]|uniref:Uncharacterized protein n=1 Tax=Paralabilibaculum antarcticum TaxID=2912572 RepID=A0ABT5VV55_9BACT|nr:hypothetical protein [Labilibaculum sp. DW002]MDE5419145.1 hypothetical protein [Labilibaculum sp. DW002]
MADDNISKGAGIIPDFFHDIIAYIIPGYIVIVTVIVNITIITNKGWANIEKINFASISISFIVAYVLGRFFEQLGKITIHNRVFPFVLKAHKRPSPKWTLIFDEENDEYSSVFKARLIVKIKEWYKTTLGDDFIEKCKFEIKDDYFNLIQFYLRERFPAVALYEKKQNATIVLTRSLTLIFFSNILLYPIVLGCLTRFKDVTWSPLAFIWILGTIIFSIVLYSRFKQDQKYHAMYIFENFMGLKKLLSS